MQDAALHILLVEDNENDALLLQETLAQFGDSFHLTHATSATDAEALLHQAAFDAMLLDLSLPDTRGMETILWANRTAPRLPVIILTGMDDERMALEAVRKGAQDYILKGQSDARLLARALHYAIERKRVEEALRDSEQRLRAVFEATEDAIIICDSHGRLIEANPGAARLLRLPLDDLLGRCLTDFLPSDFDFRLQWDKFLLKGQLRCDHSMVRADGTRVEVDCYSVANILPGRHLSVIRDITVRKRMEAELQRSRDGLEKMVLQRTADLHKTVDALQEEVVSRRQAEVALREANDLLEMMFSGIHLHVAYMDTEFTIIRVNDAYAAVDGQDPQFFVGKNHFDLFPNEENQAIFRETVRTGEPCFFYEKPFEYKHHPERGTSYWDWSLQPVKDPRGQVKGLILSLLDVSDRVGSRRQLDIERRRLFSVLQLLPGYVSLNDSSHSIRYANSKFVELFGQPGKLPCHKALHGLDRPCPDCRMPTIVEKQQPQQWEWTGPDGRSYHVWGYPFADTDGSHLVMELGLDVTERKQLERKILDVGSLERRRIGQDLHDTLGQNLTGIAFLSKAVARSLGSRGVAEAAQVAEIARQVNEAIAKTRSIAHGLCPVGLTEDGLTNGLRELLSSVEQLCKVRGRLWCDRDWQIADSSAAVHIYSIVQEAVNNAVRHGKAKNIEVRLEAQGEGVCLSIKDDGVGLPQDVEAAKGMGLHTMRYRAETIGAVFSIGRAAPRGTCIACLLPKGLMCSAEGEGFEEKPEPPAAP